MPIMFSKGLICIAVLPLLIMVCMGGELSESKSLFNFIKAVDPKNVLNIDRNGLVLHSRLHKLKGVKYSLQATTSIVEIRLDNLNLSGTIDADALCKLPNLRVLSLAKNHIRGNIPNSILYCTRLTYLNLSSNLLSGRVPVAVTKLKYLRSLDISNNHFTTINPHFKYKTKHLYTYSMESSAADSKDALPESSQSKKWFEKYETWIPLVLGIGLFLLLAYFMGKKAAKIAKEREILKCLKNSPPKAHSANAREEAKIEKGQSELVFFVEQHERFTLEDLHEATADLRSQSLCSSLFKVILRNSALYAVKRLKKLQVFLEEFNQTMREIGNLKHPSILPLVGYNSTNEEKLMIYKYQSNGSLLNLMEDYIDGKRDFPWELQLSIASGIARGLDFIYQSSDDRREIIPHGNLKLSNILLDENDELLISENGFSRFQDPKKACILTYNGYTAPEKSLSEQADAYSFGVILLELLTGKTVEKNGINLPKWVGSMVREEWTGEVFDKEVSKVAIQWAFPLLNIALKCVSHSPENRPTMAEVLEKIEEVMNAQEDHSISLSACCESSQHDCCELHTILSETWDTPGSNY